MAKAVSRNRSGDQNGFEELLTADFWFRNDEQTLAEAKIGNQQP